MDTARRVVEVDADLLAAFQDALAIGGGMYLKYVTASGRFRVMHIPAHLQHQPANASTTQG